jgi:multidrug efflux system membrane fusion protein
MIQSDTMNVHSPHQPGIQAATPRTPPPLPPLNPRPETGHSHIWVWLILFTVAAGMAALIFWRVHSQAAAAAKAAARVTPPAPVLVTNVNLGDLPIYLPELGTVTPFNTVTLRTRISGEMNKVDFNEGQIVQANQLVAEIDPRPYQAAVEQAQGQLTKDQATLENDKLNLTRYQSAAAGTFTQQQIDTQKATVDQDVGIVQSDQGNLDNAKVQLVYCSIISPLTGRIGLRQVDPGNFVQPSDTNGLAVITQLQPISVVFTIADVDIPKVMGSSATIPKLEADAYNSDLSKKLATGSLYAVDSSIDPTTAKLKMKAVFDNKDYALFPNQFVNIQLLVRTLHKAMLIPVAAVQRGPDNSTYVYVVKSDNTADVRNIVLGPQQGDLQAVRSGLQVGDTVITDGVDKLQQGSPVSPKPMPSATPATQPTTQESTHHHHHSQDESGTDATTRTAE